MRKIPRLAKELSASEERSCAKELEKQAFNFRSGLLLLYTRMRGNQNRQSKQIPEDVKDGGCQHFICIHLNSAVVN